MSNNSCVEVENIISQISNLLDLSQIANIKKICLLEIENKDKKAKIYMEECPCCISKGQGKVFIKWSIHLCKSKGYYCNSDILIDDYKKHINGLKAILGRKGISLFKMLFKVLDEKGLIFLYD